MMMAGRRRIWLHAPKNPKRFNTTRSLIAHTTSRREQRGPSDTSVGVGGWGKRDTHSKKSSQKKSPTAVKTRYIYSGRRVCGGKIWKEQQQRAGKAWETIISVYIIYTPYIVRILIVVKMADSFVMKHISSSKWYMIIGIYYDHRGMGWRSVDRKQTRQCQA